MREQVRVGLVRARDGSPEVVERRHQPVELRLVELIEDPAERVALEHLDVGKDRSARRRQRDADHPAVLVVAAPLDEPALRHPVDEARRVRERDVERLGDPAHCHRAVPLEHREDVQVRHAHAPPEEALAAQALHLPEDEPELGDHLRGELGTVDPRGCGFGSGALNS